MRTPKWKQRIAWFSIRLLSLWELVWDLRNRGEIFLLATKAFSECKAEVARGYLSDCFMSKRENKFRRKSKFRT